MSDCLRLFILLVAGWINQDQQKIIDYLTEEIGVYQELCKGKRLRFTNKQRRSLGVRARALGRKTLEEFAGIVTPERTRPGTPWKTFLAAYWEVLAAMDFFTVEVLTFAGIIRYHVLFAIRLETREVQIVGITAQPSEPWMKQLARNLTDPFDGFLRDVRYLIMDLRSTVYRRLQAHAQE